MSEWAREILRRPQTERVASTLRIVTRSICCCVRKHKPDVVIELLDNGGSADPRGCGNVLLHHKSNRAASAKAGPP